MSTTVVDKFLPPGIAAYLAKEERDLAQNKIHVEPSSPRTKLLAASNAFQFRSRLQHVVLLFRGWVNFVSSFSLFVLATLNGLCARLCFFGNDDDVNETKRLIKSLAQLYVVNPPSATHLKTTIISQFYPLNIPYHTIKLHHITVELSHFISDVFVPLLQRVLTVIKAGTAIRLSVFDKAVECVERIDRVNVADGFWRSQLRTRRQVYDILDGVIVALRGTKPLRSRAPQKVLDVKVLRAKSDDLCEEVCLFCVQNFERSKLFFFAPSHESRQRRKRALVALARLRRGATFLEAIFGEGGEKKDGVTVFSDSRLVLWDGMTLEEARAQKEALDRKFDEFVRFGAAEQERGEGLGDNMGEDAGHKEEAAGHEEEEEEKEFTFEPKYEEGKGERGVDVEEEVTLIFSGAGTRKPEKRRKRIEGKGGGNFNGHNINIKPKAIDGKTLLSELQGRFRNMPPVKTKEVVFDDGVVEEGEEEEEEEEVVKENLEVKTGILFGEAASFGLGGGGLFAALQSKVAAYGTDNNDAIVID